MATLLEFPELLEGNSCLVANIGKSQFKLGGSPLNKAELVAAVAEKGEFTKKDAERAVAAVFDSITQALAAGEKVQLVGFGTFEVKNREERVGRNPQTKEEIVIPACKVPGFKAGKALKESVQ